MSKVKVLWLSVSLTPILAVACWLAISSSPDSLMAQIRRPIALAAGDDLPRATVPPDPYELATGPVQFLSQPADRLAALTLLRNAAAKSISHAPKMSPFSFKVTFNATGNLTYTGSVEL